MTRKITPNLKKKMEKILTDIVKEKGISKIILDYKKQFDNITFCSSCSCPFSCKNYSSEFYTPNIFKQNKFIKEHRGNFCRDCYYWYENYFINTEEEILTFERYRLGRHGIYRKVSDEFY